MHKISAENVLNEVVLQNHEIGHSNLIWTSDQDLWGLSKPNILDQKALHHFNYFIFPQKVTMIRIFNCNTALIVMEWQFCVYSELLL